MNDFVGVAVIYARQNLLYKDGRVFLCELSSCDYLIEELASFADSKRDIRIIGSYSVTM